MTNASRTGQQAQRLRAIPSAPFDRKGGGRVGENGEVISDKSAGNPQERTDGQTRSAHAAGRPSIDDVLRRPDQRPV